MKSSRYLVVAFMCFYSLAGHAGENILVPMVGMVDWSSTQGHRVRGSDISFSSGSEGSAGFKYLYLFDFGLAVGGNLFTYTKEVREKNLAEDSVFIHNHVLLSYFFNQKGDLKPYVGVGTGYVFNRFRNGTLDLESSLGNSSELNLGFLWSFSRRVGLQLEYKYVNFNLKKEIDNYGTKIKSNAHTLFLGVSVHI